MSSARQTMLAETALLLDIGFIGISLDIACRSRPLTENEEEEFQLHPMRGLDLAKDMGLAFEQLNGIMHHHERHDGLGYPMGLAGHEIPEFARVIAVADAFDSMTSTRSYREAKSIEAAVAELRRGAGMQFDPLLVEAFIAALTQDGWQLPELAVRPPDLGAVTVQDHDDPTAPLQVIIP